MLFSKAMMSVFSVSQLYLLLLSGRVSLSYKNSWRMRSHKNSGKWCLSPWVLIAQGSFNSCWGLRYFLCTPVIVDYFIFTFNLPSIYYLNYYIPSPFKSLTFWEQFLSHSAPYGSLNLPLHLLIILGWNVCILCYMVGGSLFWRLTKVTCTLTKKLI